MNLKKWRENQISNLNFERREHQLSRHIFLSPKDTPHPNISDVLYNWIVENIAILGQQESKDLHCDTTSFFHVNVATPTILTVQ